MAEKMDDCTSPGADRFKRSRASKPKVKTGLFNVQVCDPSFVINFSLVCLHRRDIQLMNSFQNTTS